MSCQELGCVVLCQESATEDNLAAIVYREDCGVDVKSCVTWGRYFQM